MMERVESASLRLSKCSLPECFQFHCRDPVPFLLSRAVDHQIMNYNVNNQTINWVLQVKPTDERQGIQHDCHGFVED